MIDSCRMQPPRLRFAAYADRPDLLLEVGMHHVGLAGDGLGLVEDGPASLACFCVDRRGVWLTVGSGARSVHVNGREVRRLAMLRAGDSVYLDGHEVRLVGAAPQPGLPDGVPAEPSRSADPRVVLRGLGGRHHGRSFTLDAPRLVGSADDADIRIDNPAFAGRHARMELVAGEVWLRDLGSEDGSIVNGERVRDALLRPGDQVVFDANDRFVVEAPLRGAPQQPLPVGTLEDAAESNAPGRPGSNSWWRLPAVLVAALLIALLLGLLLLYGAG